MTIIEAAEDVAARLAGEADALFGEARYHEALACYRQAISHLAGRDARLFYRASFAAWEAGAHAEAGRLLREAARLAPRHPAAHQALADWCLNTGDVAGALHHSGRAAEIAPGEPEVRASRAAALCFAGDADAAWALARPLLGDAYCPARAVSVCGQLARRFNAIEETLRSTLSRLDASGTLAPANQSELHFVAAYLLDQSGHFDKAFRHAAAAHDANRRPYDPQDMPRQVDHRIEYYTPAKLHDLPRASHGSRKPLFILGMPRSGTTLIEQILASHPDVYGAGELMLLGELAASAASGDPEGGFDYPGCLDAFSLRRCDKLAAQYLAEMSRIGGERTRTARYVVNKMPENFLYIGMIAMLFPDSHVIHCVRDPRDTCLSCYMTAFTTGHEFAQDLSHLGAYHNQYRRLMSHWRDTLNYPMIEVRYEEVVKDLEGETRRLLALLDLPWDPACLEFHRNPRHVATASHQQVRRPVYDRSVGRWRHYESHLAPLLSALSSPVD